MIKLLIFLALFLSCDLRTQDQQWYEKQKDLKRLGIEYVPMYFELDRRFVPDLYMDDLVKRLPNFSKFLVVKDNLVYGYFLVDSLHLIYGSVDNPYFHPSLDTI